MSYPEDTPTSALCYLEGCWWGGGSVCRRCGERLRCLCGQFVRDDHFDDHIDACAVVAAVAAYNDDLAASE